LLKEFLPSRRDQWRMENVTSGGWRMWPVADGE